MKLKLFGGVLLGLTLLSCNKKLEPTHLGDQEYMPLNVGNYWVYDVINKKYNGDYEYDSSSIRPSEFYLDSSSYQVKEELSAIDYDLEGNEYFELKRYKRDDAQSSWTLDSVWVAKYVANQFVRIENNINYVKLKFPINLDMEWDVNQYNSIEKDETTEPCLLSKVDSAFDYSDGNQSFSNLIRVVHYCNTDDILIRRDNEVEYYGKDVGMIYKLVERYEYCQDSVTLQMVITTDTSVIGMDTTFVHDTSHYLPPSCNGKKLIDNGQVIEMHLQDYHIVPIE